MNDQSIRLYSIKNLRENMRSNFQEQLNAINEIINRSQNRVNQAKFGLPMNIQNIIQEINHEFFTLDFIAKKSSPQKSHVVNKIHKATISVLLGQISEDQYESIMHGLGQKHGFQVPRFPKNQKQARQNPNIKNIQNLQKMFTGGK